MKDKMQEIIEKLIEECNRDYPDHEYTLKLANNIIKGGNMVKKAGQNKSVYDLSAISNSIGRQRSTLTKKASIRTKSLYDVSSRPVLKKTNKDNIQEIIPDDLPEWVIDAMNRGQFFKEELEKELSNKDTGILDWIKDRVVELKMSKDWEIDLIVIGMISAYEEVVRLITKAIKEDNE